MPHLIGIDTGGTYTDAVLFDEEQGVLAAAKALTTKDDLIRGIREAVEAVLPDPAPDIGLVSLSTTLATNALVEGQGGRVCLLLIGYDPGALARSGLHQALAEDPVVFLEGGHNPFGEAQSPLDVDATEAAIERYKDEVSAFAVTGYFSVRNPAHENEVRDLVHRLSGLPVTCGHELSAKLDAPRRALTTLLNARLIPLLHELVRSVRDLLAEKRIEAPLMVVKGDGALVDSEAAMLRPIETILSGPAASLVGARYLAGEDDAVVADIGGTTTDIAVLKDGYPALNEEGAMVGGWRTMVEAAAVHTVGLGGDSELHFSRDEGLSLGPRRVVPLSLLARNRPELLAMLRDEAERAPRGDYPGRFAFRLRGSEADAVGLRQSERALLTALSDTPMPFNNLIRSYLDARALDRLINRGLAATAGFTPSDAAHVLGIHDSWSREAATLGAEIWSRHVVELATGSALPKRLRPSPDPAGFCRQVLEQVTQQSCRALIGAALAGDGGGRDQAVQHERRGLGRYFLDLGLAEDGATSEGRLLNVSFNLRHPLVGIGAPAPAYFPAIAQRLNCRLAVPDHAGVCNAVGAVASGIRESVTISITAPREGLFRLHGEEGIRDFDDLDAALAVARSEARLLAEARARSAGAGDIVTQSESQDRFVPGPGGMKIFIESTVTAKAIGRPRITAG